MTHAMLDLAGWRPGEEQLWDPCAGTGGILRAAAQRMPKGMEFMELNAERVQALLRAGYTGQRGHLERDRYATQPTLIAMNPSFAQGAWIDMLAWAARATGAWAGGCGRVVCAVPGQWHHQLGASNSGTAEELRRWLTLSREYTVRNLPHVFEWQGRNVPVALLYVQAA